jgi:hypothetical protein
MGKFTSERLVVLDLLDFPVQSKGIFESLHCHRKHNSQEQTNVSTKAKHKS